MKKARKINGLNKTLNQGPATFKHDQVSQALLDIQDTLERAMTPFVLLEGVAKQLYEEQPFELKEITIGIKEKDWTRYGSTTFKMLRPEAEFSNDSVYLSTSGVPVIIWIIHKNYKFFDHPDFKWFARTEFYIPNPFANYWKARFLIK